MSQEAAQGKSANSTYHTVVIDSKLEPIEIQGAFNEIPTGQIEQYWLKKVPEVLEGSNGVYKPLFTTANGPTTKIIADKNPIVETFVLAYNNHQDLILSPDDMWLLVCLKFAKYVNNNAEAMRPYFVSHTEGKIELKVVEVDTPMEEFWKLFFIDMQQEINKNVKGEICELLTANFTSTGKVEALLSAGCLMHTFQPYFDYTGYSCISCGIRQVHFLASARSAPAQFNNYLDGLLPIFDQFIETYEGRVDQSFWIKVCDTKRERFRDGYMFGERERLTGWVLKLVDNNEKELDNIRVPVKFVNEEEGTTKQCYIVGGFHGMCSTKDYKHRPVMSLSVVEEVKKETKESRMRT
ncbi:unnamed protein product, partial [Didymodactylos carnosus]